MLLIESPQLNIRIEINEEFNEKIGIEKVNFY
jgi:hypothetical protein